MTHLGRNQLRMLANISPRQAYVVPCRITRSLVKRGLMAATPSGAMAHITPAGLRALADAAERGDVNLFSLEQIKEANS